MATGTGKTLVAFQICWKLWTSWWNRAGEHRKPRILYLSDRTFLVTDPKDKMFAPFGEARHKIEGEAIMSREMYFSLYQSLAGGEGKPGLYKEYPQDYFDLIIVDECHRGGANEEGNWPEILEWFKPAYQLGMTATPLREDNRDTYLYFGNPVYTYSLRQGIDDGFLAPYRVHRVITQWDAAGWRPTKDEIDRYGRLIPDEEYHTGDFEREISLLARTKAIARHLYDFMGDERYAKTIVFCVDQEHANTMRQELSNLNYDLARLHPDFVCRVTSDEGDIGLGHMGDFQDPEKNIPVILTTSQLLSTGLDAPTCKNIVLARNVNSMTEFKQIIGRGTRVKEDYNKLWFNIIDYTGSATRNFADPEFDGEPALATEEEIDEHGKTISREIITEETTETEVPEAQTGTYAASPYLNFNSKAAEPKKFYYDGGSVQIVTHIVSILDPDGNVLRVESISDYAKETIRTLFPSIRDLRNQWANPRERAEIIKMFNERGIDFAELAGEMKQPDADPFDLLCNLVFNTPLRTRRERANRVRSEKKDFLANYSPQAREILYDLLEKYAEYGEAQFTLPDILKVPPLSNRGNASEISALFGGAEELRNAVEQLQTYLYL